MSNEVYLVDVSDGMDRYWMVISEKMYYDAIVQVAEYNDMEDLDGLEEYVDEMHQNGILTDVQLDVDEDSTLDFLIKLMNGIPEEAHFYTFSVKELHEKVGSRKIAEEYFVEHA